MTATVLRSCEGLAQVLSEGGHTMSAVRFEQVEEHHQVRRDCGVFDVSHMTVVDVSGAQAKS